MPWIILAASFAIFSGPATTGWTSPASEDGAPIDFNRDVRPILSNNCFLCHGPDPTERKGGLRLDTQEGAFADLGGYSVIVPGNVEESELIGRLAPDDPTLIMPPKKTGKSLTKREIDVLTRWVREGAKYSKHWSYERPIPHDPPMVGDPAWCRYTMDRFVLARLEREGLKPSPEADKYALARRATLDLTGLPPTPEEVDTFVHDTASDAFERFVDRQLAKPSYGEHWARLWLDLARYADSAGYADDPGRTIWAYRDWVIRAFNKNMPFDQFTIEQLAGDLLPNPTDDQLVATAFHRNTMTNSEGGTNDEEFRNVAIVDRVNTTWTVWMGTSMTCGQCHNHKYDPFSQKDFFRFFAILNNTQDADRPDESPVLPLETEAQRQEKTALQAEIRRLETCLRTTTPELDRARERWEAAFPRELTWDIAHPALVTAQKGATFQVLDDGSVRAKQGQGTDTYSVVAPIQGERLTALRLEAIADPELPGGGPGLAGNGNFVLSRLSAVLEPAESKRPIARFVRVTLPGMKKYLSLAEVQVFRGDQNVAPRGEASQVSTDFEGPAKLAIDGKTNGDFDKAKSTTHTALADDPWWEVDLKESGPIDRVVVWNRTDNRVGERLKGAVVRLLNEARETVWEGTLEAAPKTSVEFLVSNAKAITFKAALADFEQTGFGAAGVIASATDKDKKGWGIAPEMGRSHALVLVTDAPVEIAPGSGLRVTLTQEHESDPGHTLGRFRLSTTHDPNAAEYARTPPKVLAILRKPKGERTAQEDAAIVQHFLSITPELNADREKLAVAKKRLSELKPYTTVPVMRELPEGQRRVTKVQRRGNFLDLAEEVTAGTPEALHPLPAETPPNRLSLARWIVSPDNPLTARVIANRYWEQIFGTGLVRTSEEFGAQGELPSHPELLDWLATELVRSGWDTKAFLKMLVTSATYRQSSKVTRESYERDPENRLLARGPRFRISAEVVRDQALAVSGLLSDKSFGPPVNPPRPITGLNAAFGSAIDKKTSTGEDRYRRALYTEWRRSNPYPSMTTFDAPNRDICTVRRTRTNTPLQALVTMNDPVYVEASQALARRIVQGAGTSEDRAKLGVRLTLIRPAQEAEIGRLVALFQDARAEFAKDPAKAKKMALEPLGPAPEGADLVELASWTVVANVLLNLDEVFLKR